MSVSESDSLRGRLAIKVRQIRPGTAQAISVKAGQLVQIVDVQGKQVADFVAFNANDKNEYLSVAVTRSANNNVMLQKGQTLYSNRRNPMMEITEDSVGRHDTLMAACDPKRYEALDAPGHANCRTALSEALQGFGVDYDHIPDPVNWFMNVAIRQRGELEIREPLSERSDQVQLTALMDLEIAVSACPQDLNPTNGSNPTDILIRIYREPFARDQPAAAADGAANTAAEAAPAASDAAPDDPGTATAEAAATVGEATAEAGDGAAADAAAGAGAEAAAGETEGAGQKSEGAGAPSAT